MVGNRPVRETEFIHRVGDFIDRSAAITPISMIVQRASEIGPFCESRQGPLLCGVKLALIFAQFRSDVRKAELLENLVLSCAIHAQRGIACFFGGTEQSVFVEAQAAVDGALTHNDVVLFAASEISERERKFDVAYYTEVG